MNKFNVVVVHGAYGYPSENWFGWIKQELEKLEIECLIPEMPTPKDQNLSSWLNVLNHEYIDRIHDNTVLIGHSLGAAFLMRWLELSKKKVFSTILVGTFIGKVGIEKFDTINASFFLKPFNWEIIKQNAKYIFCYHGSNDPYVSKSDFDYIAKNLSAQKIIIPDGGHINAAAGYTSFPQLLTLLKGILKENIND